jgi:hypothetical protein
LLFVAVVRLLTGSVLAASLRPGLAETVRLLLSDADQSWVLGLVAVVAAMLARPLFALPAALVRLTVTAAALGFLALDAVAASFRLSSGRGLVLEDVRSAAASGQWFTAAPRWLSDPWHLALTAILLLVLLLAGLWLARLVEEAFEAAREAPFGHLAGFVAVLVMLSWVGHRAVAAVPPPPTLQRWSESGRFFAGPRREC